MLVVDVKFSEPPGQVRMCSELSLLAAPAFWRTFRGFGVATLAGEHFELYWRDPV
jgi:hypothetical protein